jgi:tetrahydromethanopterin S-methyltransferase subunit F
VAKNSSVSDGEKALWIIGFIIMGFVTAIVFLIMAKDKKFVE